MTLEDELPRLEGVQYTTEEEQRAITNSSRKNEVAGPKQKQRPVVVVDVAGDGRKARCWKELFHRGIWNVRSMNQGKLEVVK